VADGWTAGEALAWAKASMPGDGWTAKEWGMDLTGYAWYSKAQFHLYGDPTRSLEACETGADCPGGTACGGTATCVDGFCVRAPVTDCSLLDGPCLVGMCDDATGDCVEAPRADGTPCDDGAWCTEADACEAGACAGVERSCGERDGWVTWCDEAEDTCLTEPEAGEEPEDSGGCMIAPRRPRMAGFALGLALAAVLGRRRAVFGAPGGGIAGRK
jgi:hypothetical protein